MLLFGSRHMVVTENCNNCVCRWWRQEPHWKGQCRAEDVEVEAPNTGKPQWRCDNDVEQKKGMQDANSMVFRVGFQGGKH